MNLELRDTSKLSSLPFNLPRQLSAFTWALRNFDVFHFHAGLTLLPRKLNLPALKLARKGIVFQSWGSDLRGRRASEVRYLRSADAVIVGSYLTRRLAPRGSWPEYDVVHPALDLTDWEPSPTEPGDVLRVAHAPSKRAVKGTDTVLAAVESLRARGAPHRARPDRRASRTAKRACATPPPTSSSTSSASAGTGCSRSSRWRSRSRSSSTSTSEAAAETEEAFGLKLPLIRASESDLEDVLVDLIDARETLPALGRRSRGYVEQVHGHLKVARQVLEIYERVMPSSS